jgi:transcriptional regulator with XRE-family HTH domain
MNFSEGKFESFVSTKPSGWEKDFEFRIENKRKLRRSARIAMRVLRVLRQRNMTQTALAELIKVSPQYINKLLRGYENLSFDTIDKLEVALNIKLIEVVDNDQFSIVDYSKHQLPSKPYAMATLAGKVIMHDFNYKNFEQSGKAI